MKPAWRRRRSWLRDYLLLASVLAVAAAAGAGFVLLLERGRPARQALTRDVERSIADAVESSVRAAAEVVDHPEVVGAVGRLQSRLESALNEEEPGGPAKASGGLNLPPGEHLPAVRVLVVEAQTVNAVALPGNIIILYTGLIRSLGSSGELAGVMAHELGHCIHRDPRNALIRELGLSVLLGGTGGAAAGDFAGEVVRGAVGLRYGRRAEARADEFAVRILAAAGLDPSGYARALDSLAGRTGDSPDWAGRLDVHPPMEQRIQDARTLAEALTVTGNAASPEIRPDEDWAILKAALDFAAEPDDSKN